MGLQMIFESGAKYVMVEESTKSGLKGAKLTQIKAIKDIKTHGKVIKAGQLGGWIENESCLSHMGDCWVDESSQVSQATIEGNTFVFESTIHGKMKINSKDLSIGHTTIYADGSISSTGQIYNSVLQGKFELKGEVDVEDCDINGSFKISSDFSIKDKHLFIKGGKPVEVSDFMIS